MSIWTNDLQASDLSPHSLKGLTNLYSTYFALSTYKIIDYEALQSLCFETEKYRNLMRYEIQDEIILNSFALGMKRMCESGKAIDLLAGGLAHLNNIILH